jgi:hypothetical protein
LIKKTIPVEADDQAACDFGVEGAGVSGFFDVENLLDPGDDLVGAGIGGLIKVDHSVLEIIFQRALEWGGSCGDRGVVGRKDIHFVIIL